MASAGLRGVEGTLRISRRPSRTKTQSVKVPPVSTAMRMGAKLYITGQEPGSRRKWSLTGRSKMRQSAQRKEKDAHEAKCDETRGCACGCNDAGNGSRVRISSTGAGHTSG